MKQEILNLMQECINEISSKDCDWQELGRYVWPDRWNLLKEKLDKYFKEKRYELQNGTKSICIKNK
jgi:hypothetical protein